MESKLTKIMRRACDGTKARKDGVLVRTEDWHALMRLASDSAASQAAPGAEVEPVAYVSQHTLAMLKLNGSTKAPLTAAPFAAGFVPLYLSPPTTDAIKAQARAVLSAHVETLRRALEWMKNASTSMEIEWGTWQTQAEVERDGKVSEKEIADMEDLIRTLAGEER